jgi:hypothetical protein
MERSLADVRILIRTYQTGREAVKLVTLALATLALTMSAGVASARPSHHSHHVVHHRMARHSMHHHAVVHHHHHHQP